MRTLKRTKGMYALLCDSGEKEDEPLVCGVFDSKAGAQEANMKVKSGVALEDCPCKHVIRKCSITVTF